MKIFIVIFSTSTKTTLTALVFLVAILSWFLSFWASERAFESSDRGVGLFWLIFFLLGLVLLLVFCIMGLVSSRKLGKIICSIFMALIIGLGTCAAVVRLNPSSDLTFLAVEGGYAVGGGRGMTGVVVVPPEHNDQPVVAIQGTGFRASTITAIVLPRTIRVIEHQAFENAQSLESIVLHSGIERVKGVQHLSHAAVNNTVFRNAINLTIYDEMMYRESDGGGISHYPWNHGGWIPSGPGASIPITRPIIRGVILSEDGAFVVSFMRNAGSIYRGTFNPEISPPFRVGYVFGGWTTSVGSVVPDFTAENVYTAPNGTKLYAIWIAS